MRGPQIYTTVFDEAFVLNGLLVTNIGHMMQFMRVANPLALRATDLMLGCCTVGQSNYFTIFSVLRNSFILLPVMDNAASKGSS